MLDGGILVQWRLLEDTVVQGTVVAVRGYSGTVEEVQLWPLEDGGWRLGPQPKVGHRRKIPWVTDTKYNHNSQEIQMYAFFSKAVLCQLKIQHNSTSTKDKSASNIQDTSTKDSTILKI